MDRKMNVPYELYDKVLADGDWLMNIDSVKRNGQVIPMVECTRSKFDIENMSVDNLY